MLLTIDAGNTNIVFAVYLNREQKGIWRFETKRDRSAQGYADAFLPIFGGSGLQVKDVDGVIISSVVPQTNDALKEFALSTFGFDAMFVSAESLQDKITINLDKVSEVGTDRIVNAIAVANHYQSPAIVVDFGTATTFDVIGASGSYEGGVIAPGINLSMEALHKAAAQLPDVEVAKPAKVIGKSTIEAMQSGIFWGYVGLIEGTLKRIAGEMDADPFILATGGLAPLFAEGTDMIGAIDQDLTLKGLLDIYHDKK